MRGGRRGAGSGDRGPACSGGGCDGQRWLTRSVRRKLLRARDRVDDCPGVVSEVDHDEALLGIEGDRGDLGHHRRERGADRGHSRGRQFCVLQWRGLCRRQG